MRATLTRDCSDHLSNKLGRTQFILCWRTHHFIIGNFGVKWFIYQNITRLCELRKSDFQIRLKVHLQRVNVEYLNKTICLFLQQCNRIVMLVAVYRFISRNKLLGYKVLVHFWPSLFPLGFHFSKFATYYIIDELQTLYIIIIIINNHHV